jgi:hypothetical protein
MTLAFTWVAKERQQFISRKDDGPGEPLFAGQSKTATFCSVCVNYQAVSGVSSRMSKSGGK